MKYYFCKYGKQISQFTKKGVGDVYNYISGVFRLDSKINTHTRMDSGGRREGMPPGAPLFAGKAVLVRTTELTTASKVRFRLLGTQRLMCPVVDGPCFFFPLSLSPKRKNSDTPLYTHAPRHRQVGRVFTMVCLPPLDWGLNLSRDPQGRDESGRRR